MKPWKNKLFTQRSAKNPRNSLNSASSQESAYIKRALNIKSCLRITSKRTQFYSFSRYFLNFQNCHFCLCSVTKKKERLSSLFSSEVTQHCTKILSGTPRLLNKCGVFHHISGHIIQKQVKYLWCNAKTIRTALCSGFSRMLTVDHFATFYNDEENKSLLEKFENGQHFPSIQRWSKQTKSKQTTWPISELHCTRE